MDINVKKTSGMISINVKHLKKFIYEQTILIPGIVSIKSKSLKAKIYNIFHIYDDCIKITNLGTGIIGVEIHVILSDGVNFKTIAKQIQEYIQFKVSEKYGIKVSYVDVIIEGTE